MDMFIFDPSTADTDCALLDEGRQYLASRYHRIALAISEGRSRIFIGQGLVVTLFYQDSCRPVDGEPMEHNMDTFWMGVVGYSDRKRVYCRLGNLYAGDVLL